MDFIDQIRALAVRIPKMMDYLQTEEATKNALIMPFINALGYNVFDPTEVLPEFTADVGTKKGEKVDYALMKDGAPIILFECKKARDSLEQHGTQLYRYFSVTPARIAVLTNGIIYRFFSDLEEDNKMDSKPFLEFNLLDFTDAGVMEIKKFSKPIFDMEEMLTAAKEMKYAKSIRLILEEQWKEPSEDFVKFFAAQVYTSGRITQAVREQFQGIVKRVLHQYLNDQINRRLKTALESGDKSQDAAKPDGDLAPGEEEENEEGVITTQDEIDGFHIVKAIARSVVDGDRVVMRDTKSYCNILLDGGSRKAICRLRFNSASKKYLGLFDAERNEEKVLINSLDDVYKYKDRLLATVQSLLTSDQKEA